MSVTMHLPTQASVNTWAPRVRTYANAFVTPVIQPAAQNIVTVRTTKRGTTAINYAEDGYDEDDFDTSDGPRRPTGLRSLRTVDPSHERKEKENKLGQEIYAPVQVQGIQREWLARHRIKRAPTNYHDQLQSELPTTLIPIRVDLDVPAHQPAEAIQWSELRGQSQHAAFRRPEAAPPYRIKDTFLWNLHEALITPQDFADHLVHELDFPNREGLTVQISNQIRQQLEEYAGVALHPLFHVTHTKTATGGTIETIQIGSSREPSAMATPAPVTPSSPPVSQPTDLTTLANGDARSKSPFPSVPPFGSVTATAEPFSFPPSVDSPDDTYRCTITLSINLLSQLYTDKFEWSLLHPPGTAEKFAKLTCSDLGLNGEWAATMTHAIYEAVLRLKKEACESGGLVGASGFDMDNMAADPVAGAGWRFDNETLAVEWEPRLEILRKDEIERREVERERQMRRLRRETARFSSTANMTVGGVPFQSQPSAATPSQTGYFDHPEATETPMGRGERSKKKRRFRSLSPLARAGTPGRGTPDMGGVSGYGGVEGRLTDWERQSGWRCQHCQIWGTAVWGVRDGPGGSRVRRHSLISLTKALSLADIKETYRHYAPTAGFFGNAIRSCRSGASDYTKLIGQLGELDSPDIGRLQGRKAETRDRMDILMGRL